MLKELSRLGFANGCRFLVTSYTTSSFVPRSWLPELHSHLLVSSCVWKTHCPQFSLPIGGQCETAGCYSEVLVLEDGITSMSDGNASRTVEVKRTTASATQESNLKLDIILHQSADCNSRRISSLAHEIDTGERPSKCPHLDFSEQWKDLGFGIRGVDVDVDDPESLSRSADSNCVGHETDEARSPFKHPNIPNLDRCKRTKGHRPRNCGLCTSRPAAKSNRAKKQSKRPSTIYAMNRLISFFMEKGYQEDAYAVYEQIPHKGLEPNYVTYVQLIKGYCDAGKLTEAVQFFEEIFGQRDCQFSSDVIIYNAMIHGLGGAGFVDEALKLVTEMRQRGCLPDLYTYNSIIYSLGKVGRVEDGLLVFEEMSRNGCTADVTTYNSLIFSLGKAGQAMKAYNLYEKMIEKGCLPDIFTFNTLLSILGKAGEVIQAMTLYNFMNSIGCQPNVYTYTTLISAFCLAGRVDDALLLSAVMTEEGCAPNTVTFNSWLHGLCKAGRLMEAKLLFHKMVLLGYVPDTVTYSILIDTSCNQGLVDVSFQLLKKLLKSSISVAPKDFIILFQSFKKVGMLKQAKRIARHARAKK